MQEGFREVLRLIPRWGLYGGEGGAENAERGRIYRGLQEVYRGSMRVYRKNGEESGIY